MALSSIELLIMEIFLYLLLLFILPSPVRSVKVLQHWAAKERAMSDEWGKNSKCVKVIEVTQSGARKRGWVRIVEVSLSQMVTGKRADSMILGRVYSQKGQRPTQMHTCTPTNSEGPVLVCLLMSVASEKLQLRVHYMDSKWGYK